MKGLEDMSSTLETADAGTTAGEIENGAELVIDVAGIVETPTSLDESTTTTTTEAADFTTDPPFDPSANTDAGIEPRTVEPATETTTDAATEQAEPGNDVAEEGDDPQYADTEVIVTEDDGEVLRDRLDVRAYKEFARRRDRSERHVGYLALGMSRAKVAAKLASDEFAEEVERLEKIVAGGWRAIKREMEAAGKAASVFQGPTKADDTDISGEILDGSFTVFDKPDSIYGTSATLDAQAPSEAVSDAWRDCTIAELGAHGLRSSLVNRLAELGYDTIGKLEDLRAKISTGAVDRWPKGIGEAKITEIENAVVGWLTANRDAGVFGAIPTSVGDEAEVEEQAEEPSEYPTTEAWDKSTPQQKIDWLGDRCAHIGTTEKARESEKAWKLGNDDWHAGKNVDACEYYPGARCDDWLRGWVTGSMEPQRVKAAAKKEEKAEKAEATDAAPSTSVDDLFG